MVKGVSRQVIVVQPADKKLYEQAIFILREDAAGITDEMLLKEAVQVIKKKKCGWSSWAWAGAGAAVTNLIWLMSHIL